MSIASRPRNIFLPGKSVIALSLLLSITACGGGSSGGSSSEPTTNKTITIEISESSQETATVAGTITRIDSIREHAGIALSQTPKSSVSADNDTEMFSSTIYVSVQELQNNADARYQIHHNTDDERYITTLTINAENTSALDNVAKAEQVTGLSTNTLVLADEQRLSNILLQLEYLAGLIKPSTMDSTKATITQYIDEEAADIRKLQDSVTAVLADYKAGEVPERRLADSLTEMDSGLAQAATIGDIVLDEFDTTLGALIAELPGNLPLTYDSNQGRYTRFTHDSLGQYTETGQWQFDPAYDWLNAALFMKDAK